MDKLLTLNEAAEFLGINTEEFENFIQEHRVPHYKIAGKFVRFSQQELEKHKVKTGNKKQIPATAKEEIEYRKEELTFTDKIVEFVKFNDFYILSFCLILALLYYIFQY